MLLVEATDNPRPVRKLCHQTQHRKQGHLVVRQIVALAIKGFLSTWRNLFGLEWQAGSSPGERCSQRMSTVPRQGFKKKSLVLRRIALESTPPPHNDGVARRVSERIESCFHV